MGLAQAICPICGERYRPEALFCPRDGAPLGEREPPEGADPYLGAQIPGQIRIEQLIGAGSMGRVYRAHQAGIDRSVAVKILHRQLSANATIVARFHREAKIGTLLLHPHVVNVMMTGEISGVGPAGDGALYLVMEHLDGISLRSALAAAGGGLPLIRALRIVLQICDAVGEAHAQGIVHRDLKPENVMLVRRNDDADFVKVLDFGVARIMRPGAEVMTKAGLIFGSPRYISPEGAEGNPVGPAGDVYALATILYQMLSGQPPFDADSHVALLLRHTHDPPPALRSIPRAAYVPEPLAAAIMQNLAKRPEERCADGRAFGRVLVEAARASGLSAQDLVARSVWLGEASPKPPAFASVEPTKQLPFVAIAHEPLAGAQTPMQFAPAPETVPKAAVDERPYAAPTTTVAQEGATRDEARRHQLRVALLLVACLAGGTALAALGALRFGLGGSAAGSPTSSGPLCSPPSGAASDAQTPPASSSARGLL
jgi:eukaryotic-like serine/threonine-protein kinase